MGKVMRKQFGKFMGFSVDEMHYISQQLLYCKRMIKKFEETGSIMNNKLPVRHRSGRSLDNAAAVNESVAESIATSLRHRSQQLEIPRSAMRRILTKDLHMHAYKFQLTQELKPTDHVQRQKFPGRVISGAGHQN